MEELQAKVEEIRQAFQGRPDFVADLVIEFAREFSADEQDEMEAILLKLELIDPINENRQQELLEELRKLVSHITEHYNRDVLDQKFAEDQELIDRMVHIPIEHPLVLVADNLVKTYASTGFTLRVDHLELRLGEITGLLGENATGKTTLFHLLAGELKKTAGEIRFPLFPGGEKRNWFKIKDHIAYVRQELPAWNESLMDTLRFEAARHGFTGEANTREVNFIIQRLGLSEHIDKSWRQLSGGYKLRFSLAKALIKGAQLILLDEPLANLDVHSQQIVLNDLYHLTRSLKKPLSILVSSQHIHEIEAVADRLYYMDEGKLEDLGPTSTYGDDRVFNIFEFSSPIPITHLMQALGDFPYERQWSTGFTFFISTNRDIEGEQLVGHLAQKGIHLDYFRDISHSVKQRFYASNLE